MRCADDIPWDEVAAYYDAYVRSEGDLEFWREAAAAADGPVLEVMCGTGRITLPLLEAGFTVTGVDRSAALTAALRAKIAARGLGERATIVDADARDFALDRRFALVFVGFQSAFAIIAAMSAADGCGSCFTGSCRSGTTAATAGTTDEANGSAAAPHRGWGR